MNANLETAVEREPSRLGNALKHIFVPGYTTHELFKNKEFNLIGTALIIETVRYWAYSPLLYHGLSKLGEAIFL